MPIQTFVVPREDAQAEHTNTNPLRPIGQPSIESYPQRRETDTAAFGPLFSPLSPSEDSSEGSADESDDAMPALTREDETNESPNERPSSEGNENPIQGSLPGILSRWDYTSPGLRRLNYSRREETGQRQPIDDGLPIQGTSLPSPQSPLQSPIAVGLIRNRHGNFSLHPERADQQTLASEPDFSLGRVGAVQPQSATNADNQERVGADAVPNLANGFDIAYSTLSASLQEMRRRSEALAAIIRDSRNRQGLEESERHLSTTDSRIASLVDQVRTQYLPRGVAPTATTPVFGLQAMGEREGRLSSEALGAQTTRESALARVQPGSPPQNVFTAIPPHSSRSSTIENTIMVQGSGDREVVSAIGHPSRPAPRAVPRLRVSSDLENERITRARLLERRERIIRENYGPSQVTLNISTVASSSESRGPPPFIPTNSPSAARQMPSRNADAHAPVQDRMNYWYHSSSIFSRYSDTRTPVPMALESASSPRQMVRDLTEETTVMLVSNDQQAANAANVLQDLYEADSALLRRPSDDVIGLGIRIGAGAPLTVQPILDNDKDEALANSSQNINSIQATSTTTYNLPRQTLEERISMSGRAQYWNRVNNERARLRMLEEQAPEL